MRALGSAVVLAAFFAAGPVFASQVLVGSRAGVSVERASDLGIGPSLGVDATVSLFRLLAVELELRQAVTFAAPDDALQTGLITSAALGLQYRIDVSSVVPFATVGAEGFRQAIAGGNSGFGYGGFFAVGVLVPVGPSWFAGVEARYGIGINGAFPSRQLYGLRFGWRSEDF